MSKDRQRTRAARAARAARDGAAAAQRSAPARGVPGGSKRPAAGRHPRRPSREPVYRLRRFPRLPWRLKAALALGWLAVAAAVLYLVPSWSGRLGLLLVATGALPLIVVLVRDPSRRTR